MRRNFFFGLLFVYPLFALPPKFSLPIDSHQTLGTSVKKQSGGTCWAHATMAAIESNLLFTKAWSKTGETGEPALAEYHLDWWNGFNKHNNPDLDVQGEGLTVHQGGDYRVAAAYLSRGIGSVRDKDGQSYAIAPALSSSSHKKFYVRDIEWLSMGSDLSGIDAIKYEIMNHGAIGTALHSYAAQYNSMLNSHYQPATDDAEPNHAVAIVGWDDDRVTQAPKPGAWLCKNSWGTTWGNAGYFWISYYDKVATHHDQMGAVAFKNTERLAYDTIYSHDVHGWRDTRDDVSEAANHFKATANQVLPSVSFYTAASDVTYSVKIYEKFDGQKFSEELSSKQGVIANSGLHTVDLNFPVYLKDGQDFYVYVKLSHGGHAFDRTSEVPVLLGSRGRVTVASKASPGESYYFNGSSWVDLTSDNETANFCIKALAKNK